jgi:hypothetical protein
MWALAIIASALIFKGNPARDWIETGFVGLALVFVVLSAKRADCIR